MKPDSSTKRRVTADWSRMFPDLDVWRPLRLLRRVGPVVQGLTLDLSSSGDGYFPTAHVHALVRDFPVISLELGHRLTSVSGVQQVVRLDRHDTEFEAAAQTLADQSPLRLDSPPSIRDVVSAYHAFAMRQAELGHPPAVREVENAVLSAAAAGDAELVSDGIALAEDLVGRWPKARLPLDWPGAQEWITSLRRASGDWESLEAIVNSQIAKHKLTKIRAAV